MDAETITKVIEHSQSVLDRLVWEIPDVHFTYYDGVFQGSDLVLEGTRGYVSRPKKIIIKDDPAYKDKVVTFIESDGIVVYAGKANTINTVVRKFTDEMKVHFRYHSTQISHHLRDMFNSFVMNAPFGIFQSHFLHRTNFMPPVSIRPRVGKDVKVLITFTASGMASSSPTTDVIAALDVGGFVYPTILLNFPPRTTVSELRSSLNMSPRNPRLNLIRNLISHELGHAVDIGTYKVKSYSGTVDEISLRRHGITFEELMVKDPDAATSIFLEYANDPKEVRAVASSLIHFIRPDLEQIAMVTGRPSHPNDLPLAIEQAERRNGFSSGFAAMNRKSQRKILSYLTTFFIEEGLLAAMT